MQTGRGSPLPCGVMGIVCSSLLSNIFSEFSISNYNAVQLTVLEALQADSLVLFSEVVSVCASDPEGYESSFGWELLHIPPSFPPSSLPSFPLFPPSSVFFLFFSPFFSFPFQLSFFPFSHPLLHFSSSLHFNTSHSLHTVIPFIFPFSF